MDKETAMRMIRAYGLVGLHEGLESDISDIGRRLDKQEDPSEAKMMRWLGFCQGYLVAKGVYDLEEVKEHSRNGMVAVDVDPWEEV